MGFKHVKAAGVLFFSVLLSLGEAYGESFLAETRVRVTDALPVITITNRTTTALVIDSIRLIAPLDSIAAGDTAILALNRLGGDVFTYDLLGRKPPSQELISIKPDSVCSFVLFPFVEFWNARMLLYFYSGVNVDTLAVDLDPPLRCRSASHFGSTQCPPNSHIVYFDHMGRRLLRPLAGSRFEIILSHRARL